MRYYCLSILAVFIEKAILWMALKSHLFLSQKGKKDWVLLSVKYLKLFLGKKLKRWTKTLYLKSLKTGGKHRQTSKQEITRRCDKSYYSVITRCYGNIKRNIDLQRGTKEVLPGEVKSSLKSEGWIHAIQGKVYRESYWEEEREFHSREKSPRPEKKEQQSPSRNLLWLGHPPWGRGWQGLRQEK